MYLCISFSEKITDRSISFTCAFHSGLIPAISNFLPKIINEEGIMKLKYIPFVILIYSSITLAGSGTNDQTLSFFRTGKQDNVLVVVGGKSGFVSDEGCTSSRAALNPNTKNSKEMFSQLLAAYMAGKKVRFYGNGCIPADSTEYINIEYVYFGQ